MVQRPRGSSFSIRFLWPKYPMVALRTPPHSPVKIGTRDVFVDVPFGQAYSKLSILMRFFIENPNLAEEAYKKKPWKNRTSSWLIEGMQIHSKKYVLGRIELRKAPPSTRFKYLLVLTIYWSRLLKYLEDLTEFLLDDELKEPDRCGPVFSKLIMMRDRFLFDTEKGASDVLISPVEKHEWEWFLEENRRFFALLRLTGDYYTMKNALWFMYYTFLFEIVEYLKEKGLPLTSSVLGKLLDRSYNTLQTSLLKEPFSPDLAAITFRRLIDLMSALLVLIAYYRETYKALSGTYTLARIDKDISMHLSYLSVHPTTIRKVSNTLRNVIHKKLSYKSWLSLLESYIRYTKEGASLNNLRCFWRTFSSFVHAPATPQILSVAEYKLWIKVVEKFEKSVKEEYLPMLKKEVSSLTS